MTKKSAARVARDKAAKFVKPKKSPSVVINQQKSAVEVDAMFRRYSDEEELMAKACEAPLSEKELQAIAQTDQLLKDRKDQGWVWTPGMPDRSTGEHESVAASMNNRGIRFPIERNQ